MISNQIRVDPGSGPGDNDKVGPDKWTMQKFLWPPDSIGVHRQSQGHDEIVNYYEERKKEGCGADFRLAQKRDEKQRRYPKSKCKQNKKARQAEI